MSLNITTDGRGKVLLKAEYGGAIDGYVCTNWTHTETLELDAARRVHVALGQAVESARREMKP